MQRKTVFRLGLGVTGLLILLFFVGTCLKQNEHSIDLTKDIKIIYSGQNGRGVIEEIQNPIDTMGSRELEKFVETLDYTAFPRKALSNGDTISIEVVYDNEMAKKLKLNCKNPIRDFKVKGLVDLSNATDGENKQGMDVIIVDNVEIPKSWNLNDQEIAEYVEMVKGAEENAKPKEEEPLEDIWMKGTSTGEEKLDDMEFSNYSMAYNYGINSSQEFKIQNIQKEDGNTRYLCYFKDNVGKGKNNE
ncbi:hypothetical protein [Faecalibaculum rodentium]|uniref:hypothetical protein n=2 Tax=Erysipelotrichaceae TaxID=128827 RepID=UPI001C3D96EB|nr:hypothetical protein [Faecalibaculum rodentium]GJM59270.1 hypothetical protein EROP_29630 [Erysipelotrichaceae bacterium OPF54]